MLFHATESGNVSVLKFWMDSPRIFRETWQAGVLPAYRLVLDEASSKGHVAVLDWWVHRSGFRLDWLEKSMDMASNEGHIDVLNWWIASGLELKWTEHALDRPTAELRLEVLDWWMQSGLKL
ncbi:hypothetical protein HK405_011325, partial [Cladochytrium tenue]